MTEARITDLLHAWKGGDRSVENTLIERIYPVLHDLARAQLFRSGGPATLRATELAHEAYERLHRQQGVDWRDRSHFFAIAATVIRRVLVDHVRQRHSAKRGGGTVVVALDERLSGELPTQPDGVDWLALDQALDGLERMDSDCARVVELRVFSGLTVDEVADVLGSSSATVGRQWRFARAWLGRQLDVPAP